MNKQFTIKPMTIEDYDGLHALWMTIHGFGIRSIDDSREGVERFINRNPGTSVVAIGEDGAVVGGILCGHDGRRGCLYHVCVREDYRRLGIGKAMVVHCMNALIIFLPLLFMSSFFISVAAILVSTNCFCRRHTCVNELLRSKLLTQFYF
jgi:GNAT superfamily N-acetyltransferase